MGFIMEKYSNDYAGLVVNFSKTENSENFFCGNDVEEAMKYFNLYLENNRIRINSKSDLAINELSIKPDEATEFRSSVNGLIEGLSDEAAKENKVLFPLWGGNGVQYTEGERIRYENELYKVLTTHSSQETWNPIDAPSLFARVIVEEGVIAEWVQPESTNGYSIGDKVLFEGETYESLVDNNIWSPTDYPTGWSKI